MDKKQLGQQGERIIEKYLSKNNYQILQRNYQKQSGEIDLIALSPNKEEIIFIEVKTRKSKTYGYPEEAVNKRKLEKIETTALKWLEENNEIEKHWRIDILSLEIGKENTITHLKNVSL